MIFPWLRGFLSFEKAPMAWALVFINVFVFIMVQTSDRTQTVQQFGATDFLLQTAKYEALLKGQKMQDFWQLAETEQVLQGVRRIYQPFTEEEWAMLKQQVPDQVALLSFQEKYQRQMQELQEKPPFIYGVFPKGENGLRYFTYQFVHASLLHLISNLMLLLLFAAAIEQIIRSEWILVVYLLGGFAGALGFQSGLLVQSPDAFLPMVGASASLTALIGFFVVIERRKHVAFFYFIGTTPKDYGLVYLPKIFLFFSFIFSDFVTWINTNPLLPGQVAFTAHLGGAAFGMLAGLIALLFRQVHRPLQPVQNPFAWYSQSNSEAP